MINVVRVSLGVVLGLFLLCGDVGAQSSGLTKNLYSLGKLKPFDSELKVKSGEMAPDFTLSAVSGEKITLSQYRDIKGIIRAILVMDINKRPDLEACFIELEKLKD